MANMYSDIIGYSPVRAISYVPDGYWSIEVLPVENNYTFPSTSPGHYLTGLSSSLIFAGGGYRTDVGPAIQTSTGDGSWSYQDLSGSNEIESVSVVHGSSTEAYAICTDWTKVYHYSSGSWSIITATHSAGSTDWQSLTAASSSVLFAVTTAGSNTNGVSISTTGGANWDYMTLPAIPVSPHHVGGIWATSVSNLVVGGDGAYIAQYDGFSWTSQCIEPDSDVAGLTLLSTVWTDGANIWAAPFVQASASGVYNGAYLSRDNGATWTKYDLHTLVSGDPEFRQIWGRSVDDMWLVGDTNVILHWDGSSWSNKSPGLANTVDSQPPSKWASVWEDDSGNVYVIGIKSDPATDLTGYVLHFHS